MQEGRGSASKAAQGPTSPTYLRYPQPAHQKSKKEIKHSPPLPTNVPKLTAPALVRVHDTMLQACVNGVVEFFALNNPLVRVARLHQSPHATAGCRLSPRNPVVGAQCMLGLQAVNHVVGLSLHRPSGVLRPSKAPHNVARTCWHSCQAEGSK